MFVTRGHPAKQKPLSTLPFRTPSTNSKQKQRGFKPASMRTLPYTTIVWLTNCGSSRQGLILPWANVAGRSMIRWFEDPRKRSVMS